MSAEKSRPRQASGDERSRRGRGERKRKTEATWIGGAARRSSSAKRAASDTPKSTALHRRGRQVRRKRKRRPSGAPPLIRDGYARNRARSRTRQKQKALARVEGFVMRH
ncbi:hypothetical protein [Burkholderia sp. ABCPW 14]|uniref:hypothetical protein n=1 Tax=Burkholderia sp. ABCPW 14 TaxID=1637860 RepID=UPI0012E3F54B|nr:hypothetical protein [Burkholderia sp. ABCPW 14]